MALTFWSAQKGGWECCSLRHETRKREGGGWCGGDGVFCLGYDASAVGISQ